ncbi:AfsR/SARP family transcriptional regulator, partial [Micromonospora sp. STR1s_6]|nr:AfsR/SARP family transcriptional regulator [Micromonospora tarensis]
TGAFVDAAAAGLDEQRLLAYERLAAVELGLGRFAATARDLRPLVAEHPLREPLVAGYLLALAGCGQQAAALRIYAETRRLLVDELGVEPGPELTEAHLRVLRGQTPAEPAAAEPADPPPAQLPGAPAWFTGRAAALRQLDALLPAEPAGAARNGGQGGPGQASSSPRSPAPPGSAKPPSRCTGPTGSRTGTRTGSSTSTCAGSTSTAGRYRRARRCAASWRRCTCRPSGCPPTCPGRPPCSGPCSPTAGSWCCSTTPVTTSRCGPCYRDRRAAWSW